MLQIFTESVPALSFRQAMLSDAASIAVLINTAYRGEASKQGWTTEAYILDGVRTSTHEIQQLIESENSTFIVCNQGDDLIGSIHLNKTHDSVHIGMLAVKPHLQNLNVGKQILANAELFAKKAWQAHKFVMLVITMRHELIAFYERRGYIRTGVLQEFPVKPELWMPKVEGLKLERLEKLID